MVSASRTVHNVDITAESLQEDLVRLAVQKQALERELAAVVAHLTSVERAFSALQFLMAPGAATAPGPVGTSRGGARDSVAPKSVLPPSVPVGSSAGTALRAHPRRQGTASDSPANGPGDGALPESRPGSGGRRTYGRLTEEILDYLAEVGEVDVRARDVAAVLGRDADSGSINAVRSTLDRLVGASRIRRTGRGLYRVRKS
ncbi:hypothetical protein ACGFZA_41885 [Streptomyces sp. NPDC048211]|uniref:hypothetical protein n=1 Tax=Streptomyces sp. NPDC048211 TaxID=3365516 RepID=UPI000AC19A72